MDIVTKYVRNCGCAYSESGGNINIPRSIIRKLLIQIDELQAKLDKQVKINDALVERIKNCPNCLNTIEKFKADMPAADLPDSGNKW